MLCALSLPCGKYRFWHVWQLLMASISNGYQTMTTHCWCQMFAAWSSWNSHESEWWICQFNILCPQQFPCFDWLVRNTAIKCFENVVTKMSKSGNQKISLYKAIIKDLLWIHVLLDSQQWLNRRHIWKDSGQTWMDSGQTQNIQTLMNQVKYMLVTVQSFNLWII